MIKLSHINVAAFCVCVCPSWFSKAVQEYVWLGYHSHGKKSRCDSAPSVKLSCPWWESKFQAGRQKKDLRACLCLQGIIFLDEAHQSSRSFWCSMFSILSRFWSWSFLKKCLSCWFPKHLRTRREAFVRNCPRRRDIYYTPSTAPRLLLKPKWPNLSISSMRTTGLEHPVDFRHLGSEESVSGAFGDFLGVLGWKRIQQSNGLFVNGSLQTRPGSGKFHYLLGPI